MSVCVESNRWVEPVRAVQQTILSYRAARGGLTAPAWRLQWLNSNEAAEMLDGCQSLTG
jgi:hypothetical protein